MKLKKIEWSRYRKGKINVLVLGFALICGILVLVGGTFAWYSMRDREAVSKQVPVMEPYYLTLLNSSETDALQLSIGSLMPGQKKQITFCVSNEDNEDNVNMGGSDFDYSLELIHTENLALNYEIFLLEKAAGDGEGVIITQDLVVVDGEEVVETRYWTKDTSLGALKGYDVSEARHAAVGLTGSEVNSGKYISYEKNDAEGIDNNLHLTSGVNGYDSQHFVLEISWDENETTNFEKYEKETDMIYILVKALQPEPEKVE